MVPVVGGPDYIRDSTTEIRVEIRGRQHEDGTVERWVAIDLTPEELPADTVRLLSDALAAAHAEIARLRQDITAFPSFSESDR